MTLLTAMFFYLFSGVAIGAALMVISSRNPVHSVLFLILAFFNAAGLFMIAGAEFLALILIVVYVGAVAVLFLFVVMMLDVDFVELRQGFLQYLPVGSVVGLVLIGELLIVLGASIISPETAGTALQPIPDPAIRSNTAALGDVLYTHYIFYFQLAGLVLLVAMIGAIVLTLHHRPKVQRQNISDQVARTKETSIEVKQVESGRGI